MAPIGSIAVLFATCIASAQGNTCIAKDAAQWQALGCIFSDPTATTVYGLGTHSRVTPTTSCEVSCPVDGADFVVSSQSGKRLVHRRILLVRG